MGDRTKKALTFLGLQCQSCTFKKCIEFHDLLQNATRIALVANIPRHALQNKFYTHCLSGITDRIVWVLLFPAFEGQLDVVDCIIEAVSLLKRC